jgi:hypothetical protein
LEAQQLVLRDLVDRVLDIRREVDHACRPDADTGRDVGRQSARCRDKADRQIAGDLGDGAVLRIDLDNALGADLGDNKLAVGVYRRFSGC